ncbi:MAG: glycine cleavage system aminomethyltransferase GcvT, partial [Bacteroidota bacterium]
MKRTALFDTHVALGAKMIDFAGFEMPVRYSSQIEEHHTVRERVGIFDVSHMGEFFVRGENAEAVVQNLTSNNVAKLKIGQAQYSCFPNDKGGIVDDLLVYKLADQEFMLVVNGANIEKDWAWVMKNSEPAAQIEDRSDAMSLFAVQGPKAAQILQTLTKVDLSEIKFYTFEVGEMAGIKDVIISATGYTGSGGFELYVENENAEALWNAVLEAGKDYGITPIGLAARDTLRLEMGFCLYGNDITDETSPLEAGLGWITKFKYPFINSENLKRQKTEGVTRKLTGFVLSERGIPRQGYKIVDAADNEIGFVTSGTQSPSLKKGIG